MVILITDGPHFALQRVLEINECDLQEGPDGVGSFTELTQVPPIATTEHYHAVTAVNGY